MSLSDAARVAEPEARPAIERPQQGRQPDDDAAEHEGRQGHRRAEHADHPDGDDGRLRMLGRAEGEEHHRLHREEHAERGDELRQGCRVMERSKDGELDRDADRNDEHIGERDREWGGEREPELARAERPERESGEHGDRPCRQVDEAGAPVGNDDTDGDCGNCRSGPQAEQEEEKNLVHVAS